MKKYLVVLMVVTLVACGGAIADTGTPRYQRTYPHFHSGPEDGGSLNAPSFAVRNNATQTLTSGVMSDVLLQTTITDNTGDWLSNVQFQPTMSGVYLFTATVCGQGTTTMTSIGAWLAISSSPIVLGETYISGSWGASAQQCISVTGMGRLNGTTDYVKLKAILYGTGTMSLVYGNVGCQLQGVRVAN